MNGRIGAIAAASLDISPETVQDSPPKRTDRRRRGRTVKAVLPQPADQPFHDHKPGDWVLIWDLEVEPIQVDWIPPGAPRDSHSRESRRMRNLGTPHSLYSPKFRNMSLTVIPPTNATMCLCSIGKPMGPLLGYTQCKVFTQYQMVQVTPETEEDDDGDLGLKYLYVEVDMQKVD
ncbi:hypothetical protein MHYP_G00316070 [Metynnis hypsauchen]